MIVEDEDLIFNDTRIGLSGLFSKALKNVKEMIEKNGGILEASAISNNCDILLVRKDSPNLNTAKVKKAQKINDCDIVTEDWLYDSVKQNTFLLTNTYKVGNESEDEESSDENNSKTKSKTKTKKKSKSKTKTKQKVMYCIVCCSCFFFCFFFDFFVLQTRFLDS